MSQVVHAAESEPAGLDLGVAGCFRRMETFSPGKGIFGAQHATLPASLFALALGGLHLLSGGTRYQAACQTKQ